MQLKSFKGLLMKLQQNKTKLETHVLMQGAFKSMPK